jgi:Flp pilus assembly protein TadG
MPRSDNRLIRLGQPRGATLVEFAVVLPLVFLVVWGLFEFARLMVTADTLIAAAQEGCRLGVTPGATSGDVTAEVNNVLSSGLVSGATVTIAPSEIATLTTGEPFTVTIAVPFANVTWLPVPQFLGGKVVRTSCTMLREAR